MHRLTSLVSTEGHNLTLRSKLIIFVIAPKQNSVYFIARHRLFHNERESRSTNRPQFQKEAAPMLLELAGFQSKALDVCQLVSTTYLNLLVGFASLVMAILG